MSALIKEIESESLSKVLKEAHVKLSARELKIINSCQTMSFSTWAGYSDGDLVCVWGIVPPSVLSEEVYLWLHTTEAIKSSQFLFVRHSQIFIQELLKEYRAINGHVKADAADSKRWLKWLGARFGPPKAGLLPFRIERHGSSRDS